jgi:uncharacterized membrane protein
MGFIGLALDAIGVFIVGAGGIWAIVHFAAQRQQSFTARYRELRENLGRAILLGLEFLIAGDIIHSVVVNPTTANVAVLGLIVLIRTFLSLTLQVEIEGRWPWGRPRNQPRDAGRL